MIRNRIIYFFIIVLLVLHFPSTVVFAQENVTPLENVVLGKPSTVRFPDSASSSFSDALDGIINSSWHTNSGANTVTIDLDEAYFIKKFVFKWGNEHSSVFRISVSNVGGSYEEVYFNRPYTTGVETIELDTRARGITIEFFSDSPENGVDLKEFEAWGYVPVSEPYFISILSPTNGEVLHEGDIYRITWDSSLNLETVWVEYYTENYHGYPWESHIKIRLPNVGYYDWKVDVIPELLHKPLKIIVMGEGGGTPFVFSEGYFTVTDIQPTPTITPIPYNNGYNNNYNNGYNNNFNNWFNNNYNNGYNNNFNNGYKK